MSEKSFNYEEGFMGVTEGKPQSYYRSFAQDYRLRSLTQAIKSKKGKLLDIGCGGGILTESLPYYFPKMKMYGCDISKTAIAYAKKLGSGKVTYGVIKNKKVPSKSNSFDVAICLDVLEHIPDINFFLKEVRRILKKDGKFFLIVPCEGEVFTYTWLFQKLHKGSDLTFRYFGHIHPEFTHEYVGRLLEKYGFVTEKKSYSEHFFYQLMHVSLFFVPKILLETMLGHKRAQEYTNSSLISLPKEKNDPLFFIRNMWYRCFDFMMFYPLNWETVLLKHVSPPAWKLHILVHKQ